MDCVKPKPIFILWVDVFSFKMSPEFLQQLHDTLRVDMPDYHVILLSGLQSKAEVFSPDKLTPIELSELKEKIDAAIKH